MGTAFLLWSNPSVHQEPVIDSGEIHPSSTDRSPAPAKPKARKQGGGAASSGKRPPQRGLGVAQLERLRLQEHLEKFSAGDNGGRQLIPQQHPRQIRTLAPLQLPPQPQAAFYDSQQYAQSPVDLGLSAPRYGVPVSVPGRGCYLDCPPNPSARLPVTDPNWYLQRCISPAKLAAGYGEALPPPGDVRSLLHGQYKMDRFRTTVGVASGDSRFCRSHDVPVQEPPSSQIRQCHPAKCEFCERKKRVFGNDPIQNRTHDSDYFDGNAVASSTVRQQASEGYRSYERKDNSMKEFEFFPTSSNSTASASEGLAGYASSASDSIAAATACGDAFCTSSTSSHSSVTIVAVAAAAPTCLDLSLKL